MFELYYNQRVKIYPNGMKCVTTFNIPIFNPNGHERVFYSDREVSDRLPFGPDIRVRFDNLKRSKEKIFDIAFMNEFDYFITLTFDDSKVNSYDEDEVNHKLQKWLNNMQQRYDMSYLLVPEYHKSGRIHLHLLASGNFVLCDSGTVNVPNRNKPIRKDYARRLGYSDSDMQIVYNMNQWHYGFSTAVRIYKCDDGGLGTSAIAKYITKYMTKDLCKILKHYYYAGGNIIRDVPCEYHNVAYDLLDIPEYQSCGDLKVKYQTIGVGV